MTPPETPCDLFLSDSYEVGGAKVVTDRNLAFWQAAARRRGRVVVQMLLPPHDRARAGLWERLVSRLSYSMFCRSPAELVQVIRQARKGGDIWINHGRLGAVAALLRLLRVPGCIHLYHHNDEVRYAHDEAREEGLRGWQMYAKVGLAALRQWLGLIGAHRHYFISPAERSRHPRLNAMVLPPSWPAVAPLSQPQGDFVLLVGSRFFANLHGFGWYLEQVAPVIPVATVIAGRGMEGAFPAIEPVTVLGLVPDLTALYANARLVAVPIFKGAGTKIKLAEALHHGCQVIATPEACEGIDDIAELLRSGQVILAPGPDFAPAIRAALAAHPQGRRFDGNGFSHDRFLPGFLAFCAGAD